MNFKASKKPDIKKRILIFCDYYLPSTKSGGGMWTLVNLVERFSDRYRFFVVTRGHDSPNDRTPYTTVNIDEWNAVGKAQAHYLAPRQITARKLASLLSEVGPDCVYLNSAFSLPSRAFLWARRRRMVGQVPVILAPCGDLTPAGLRLKRWKKHPFLKFAKAVGLYRGVLWKASSEIESRDITSAIGDQSKVIVAPDLPPAEILADFHPSQKPEKLSGTVRLIFLSRITRKKNLAFLLERLCEIREGHVELTVAGPVEDEEYWKKCQEKISRLPGNVAHKMVGPVSYPEGLELLKGSHLFVLPTLTENFGYVILEALAAGSPLLISDNTMWGDIELRGAGRVISLDRPDDWLDAIRRAISLDDDAFRRMSANARAVALDWLRRPENEAATAVVLEHALSTRS